MSFNERKQEIIRRFHTCATCCHFRAIKGESGMNYMCSRLGFATKPDYTFDCWDPKEQVKQLMEKRLKAAENKGENG
ncbi:hypothetical protein [Bacillus sp. REN10]|uniref:hypothetical protein n=1 Tax=Bacillus sp. REN10 TaxID=2782541 RepID=UPI001EED053D|nr:hypothetical protein [Bacillus sp. REN10]